MVGCHGEDTVGLADEAGGDPAAPMVFERTAECADDVDGVGGGRDAVGSGHTGERTDESSAIELVERATQAWPAAICRWLRPWTAAGVARTYEEDDDARSFRKSGCVDNARSFDAPAIVVDANHSGEILIMRGSGVDDHVQPAQAPQRLGRRWDRMFGGGDHRDDQRRWQQPQDFPDNRVRRASQGDVAVGRDQRALAAGKRA